MHDTPLTYQTRSWDNEWMYSLVIDRFHDGQERVLGHNGGKGFGTPEELRKTCGGTFKGIRAKLPYLKTLGCTCILLTPFLENNPAFYHGYAIQDFTKTDPRFGSLEELQGLVNDAHRLDMRVVMDVVLNHTGNNWSYKKNHPAYHKGRSFAFSHWHEEDKPQPLSLRNEKLYSKKGHIVNWDSYPESWDGDVFELKDLVWTEDKKGYHLLDIMVEVYSYWVKALDVDGFRLDALKHIRPGMAQKFCERIKEEVNRLHKSSFILIGEVVGDMPLILSYQGLDGYFNFPFYFAWNNRLEEENVLDAFDFEASKTYVSINFLDNHDQIGIDPKRRVSSILSEEGLLLNLFMLGLMKGIPSLYYGTEQGLQDTGEMDHDIRSCMFDIHSNRELFDTSSGMFVKVSEVIRWTKEIKSQSRTIEKKRLGHSIVEYHCLNEDGVRLYVLWYRQGKKEQAALEEDQGLPVYSISGYMTREDHMPFDFKVYGS